MVVNPVPETPNPVHILNIVGNLFKSLKGTEHYLYLIDEITHKVKYYHTLAHLTGHSCTDCDSFWTV